jgi:hypothetical protein
MHHTAGAALERIRAADSSDVILAALEEIESACTAGRCGGVAREDLIVAAMTKKKGDADLWTPEVGAAYGRVMVKSMRAAPRNATGEMTEGKMGGGDGSGEMESLSLRSVSSGSGEANEKK